MLGLEARGPKEWRHRPQSPWVGLEAAVLAFLVESEGWTGVHAEGGLILTLIKAASFPRLPERLRDVYIEAIYAQNVAFEEDRFEPAWLLSNVLDATTESIGAAFRVMASSPTPLPFPTVKCDGILGLFRALGPHRLHAIAEIFAQAPYDLRAGWPDLTLWRRDTVAFREVKGPGDTLRPTQERLIRRLLQPLGYDIQIIGACAPGLGQL